MHMVTIEDIRIVAKQIADKFNPEKIILFGSYAYGSPTQESDVDLMVIMNFEGHPIQKGLEIKWALKIPSFYQLVVKSPKEIDWRYRGHDPLVRSSLDKGLVLYERAAESYRGMAQ